MKEKNVEYKEHLKGQIFILLGDLVREITNVIKAETANIH